MTTYDKFVFDEIRRIGKAWIDKNPGDHDIEQLFEKIGEMSWRRLIDQKTMWTILEEIGVNPLDYDETPAPIPNPDLSKFPRYGMSIAALVNASKCNIQETIKRFRDAGVQTTRINLFTALFPEIDCLPFNRNPNRMWDLFNWNNQYFERLQEVKEGMNSQGIHIQWTDKELYSWSRRKQGPQQNNTPWRNNVNGIFWKEDDSQFDIFPEDGWTAPWLLKIVPLLNLQVNNFEIGNEFPEKAMHERIKNIILSIDPVARVQVNRNEDTPGQYSNMKIGINYNFIAFHGRRLKELKDLDIVYSNEPDYKTFQEFIDNCPHDKQRVIFSSDGARISNDPTNTYDWEKLGEFFDHMIDLGYSIEHQSRAKMTPPPNHNMIEVDWFRERVKK